jgi:hypothetical protein
LCTELRADAPVFVPAGAGLDETNREPLSPLRASARKPGFLPENDHGENASPNVRGKAKKTPDEAQ